MNPSSFDSGRNTGRDFQQVVCPSCGQSGVQTDTREETFPYNDGGKTVELTATVEIKRCLHCGFAFLDESAGEAHHQAVCRYLLVLGPAEIKELRESHHLSRSDFADLTKIGDATIARWERGEFVQSPAYARFLYLLRFPENIARLKEYGAWFSQVSLNEPGIPRLQILNVTEKHLQDSKNFKLRRTG
jgi:putative zinc finger/helix-turn-helix YgiT family protein